MEKEMAEKLTEHEEGFSFQYAPEYLHSGIFSPAVAEGLAFLVPGIPLPPPLYARDGFRPAGSQERSHHEELLGQHGRRRGEEGAP